MPWFYLDVTDSNGQRFRDEIRAFNEAEARVAVENTGYSINRIRVKRVKTLAIGFFECVDRRIRPYKYDYIRQLEDLGLEFDSATRTRKRSVRNDRL